MIPRDFIDELLSRTDIVDVVQSRVSIKKKGKDWMGCCPFHDEKSPSFSVSQDKQFYYCFGCQASGTAIDFVMEFDRLEFPAAVEVLAGRAGMEVPRSGPAESPEKAQRRKNIYEILAQATDFFRDQLKQHPTRERAVTYLKGRGLTGSIARDYALGYAPPGWDNLLSALAKTNHERDLLIESGMVIDIAEEKKTYDRFRDRIMFPIRDNRGRPIAFGGRIIGDGKPKYLNSPETPVFHKGRELYGLYEARKLNRKLEQLIIVEGYMDVVALAQHGVTTAVATLGTATTEDHLDRLFRIVPRIIFSFDGDEAGRNAAWKALRLALGFMQDGRTARFLFVPDGEDPDSLIRREGREQFEARLDAAPPLEAVFFDHLQAQVDMASLDGKASLASLAMPLIDQIPEGVFKQLMIDRLSTLTGLDSTRLVDLYRPKETEPAAWPEPPAGQDVPDFTDDFGADYPPDFGEYDVPAGEPAADPAVERALTMVLRSPELASEFDDDILELLEKSPQCGLLVSILRNIRAADVRSPAVLLASLQETPEFDYLCRLAEEETLLNVSEFSGEFAGIVQNLVRQMESESIQEVIRSLAAKRPSELSDAEREMLIKLPRELKNRA